MKQMQKWSKSQLILFTIIWFIGAACLLLALTDLFTRPLFQSNHFVAILMLVFATCIMVFRWLQYFKREA